ncbi:MAG: peptide-methionine (S)-S-oxide reductase MsrA [Bacteroidota bacterium]
MSKQLMLLLTVLISAAVACGPSQGQGPLQVSQKDGKNPRIADYIQGKGYEQYAVATFAGGCFWCTEAAFERIEGVVDVISGYSGGESEHPTYQQIGTGSTGHAEAIQIYYDSEVISFQQLLEILVVAHDPTQLNRQGPDVGTQYRSAVFYHSPEQKEQTETYFEKLNTAGKFPKPIVTQVASYEEFWVAEAYHQDYYEHHPENPYVQRISRPKVEKVKKQFKTLLKKKYMKS